MPWEVKEKDGQHCVYKKGGTSPIKGGCHPTAAEARKHLRALYSSEAMSQPFHIIHVFSDQDKGQVKAGEPVWIHAAPYGDTSHPVYGDVLLDDLKFDRMIENFNNNVTGQDLPVRFEHFGMDSSKGFKAAGWVKDVKKDELGLHYLVDFTGEAANEINDGAWRYFSFEFDDYYETSDNQAFLDVLRGGGLTNDPYWDNMTPLNFSTLVQDHPEILDESKEIEHSEPGSGGGGEPIPREQESDQNTERGHRLDTPPHIIEQMEEDSMEEFLKKMRAELGLSDDATEDQVLEAAKNPASFSAVAEALGLEGDATQEAILVRIKEVDEELEPLRDAEKDADTKKSFREAFPEEYEEQQRLISESRENKAKAFSGGYSRFSKKHKKDEGEETVEKSTVGFSARTLDEIEKLHLAFSNGKATPDGFKSVLDSIAEVGLVDYGETGSGRTSEDDTDLSNPSKAFSDKVSYYMTEDELDRRAAVAMVRKEHPDIWAAYRNPPVMGATPK